MIYDEELQDWLDKCPTHRHEILHSDENGVVIVFRFDNQQPTSSKPQATSGKPQA